jgi:hypothetical protein
MIYKSIVGIKVLVYFLIHCAIKYHLNNNKACSANAHQACLYNQVTGANYITKNYYLACSTRVIMQPPKYIMSCMFK